MEKFVPIRKQKIEKGKPVFDEDSNPVYLDLYKGTEFEEVVAFLSKNGTDEQKKEFKRNCYLAYKKKATGRYIQKGKHKGKEIFEYEKDENGNPILEETDKFNWLYAKRKFFEEYASEYLPKEAPKEPKYKLIENW